MCAQWQAKWDGGYWLPDMQRQCWTGWHATHAVPLGVVLMFGCVCIFLLPILLLFKHRHNLKSTALKYHLGFIYQPYRYVMQIGIGGFVACIVQSIMVGLHLQMCVICQYSCACRRHHHANVHFQLLANSIAKANACALTMSCSASASS